MNGFSKDLKEKIYTGKLYHSCNLEGLYNLLNNFNSELEISFSTESSKELFGRELALIISVQEKKGEYTPFDSDGGCYYGWDEFRTTFDSVEDIEIEGIVMNPSIYKEYRIIESELEALSDIKHNIITKNSELSEEEIEVLDELREDLFWEKDIDEDIYNIFINIDFNFFSIETVSNKEEMYFFFGE